MSDANDLPKLLMLGLSANDRTRLFRNNVGQGWVGRSKRFPDGSVLVNDARPLHAGLVDGSSDLIGWHSLDVKPEHVGRRLAVFVALEAKFGTGRLSKQQIAFIEAVRRAGGVAGEARSVEAVQRMLADFGR